MDLSLITPLFNSASTVGRCMTSISNAASAAGMRVQAILVLDGPDPRTRGIVETRIAEEVLSDTVEWIVAEQEHSGIAAARNTGLGLSTSPLVSLLDADDEVTVDRLVAARNLGATSVLVGRQRVEDASGLGIPGIRAASDSSPHHLGSMVVPRQWLLDAGGFDEGYRLGDDWDAVIRLREAGHPITYLDDEFVVRHIGLANASHDTPQLTADYLKAIRRHRNRSQET